MAAAAEERFSRIKHDPRLPVRAFRYCLEEAGITPAELNAVAYYEEPTEKLSRQLWSGVLGPAAPGLDPRRPERLIREHLGWEGPVLRFSHHLSHAASSFFFSGLSEAAILTADGVGEWTTTSYGHGDGERIELFEEVRFPHSLGLLYSTITSYLGFRVMSGEYKVMGLAPYGEPRFVDQVCQLIGMGPGGQFRLNMRYFDFAQGPRMYRPEIARLFGEPPREPDSEITSFHRDLARSLQLVLEEILLEKVSFLKEKTGAADLCLAGGVALNCVANGRLLREGPFERIFIQPAAGDAGASLGAAALAHLELTGERVPATPMRDVLLGPAYPPEEIARLVAATGVAADDYRGRERKLLHDVAERLAGGQVVGWFHGRMEHGPRALGARSILADPRGEEVRERVNRRIKKREGFRPFAPSVALEHADGHFELGGPSPFMLRTCQVSSPLELPAVTHVDGSARPQTVEHDVQPRYAALLETFFERTGCPVLLNTSFNVRGEPIVCSPVDALFCFGSSELDSLVLEDFLIERAALPAVWQKLLRVWERVPRPAFARRQSAISEHLYTFV